MINFVKTLQIFASCLIASLSFAQTPEQFPRNQANLTLSGINPAKCVLKLPTRDTVTFSQERDSDGFPIKLSAENNSQLLSYTLRCNGARVTIKFTHPQLVEGPVLALNSRYFTRVRVSNPGGPTYTSYVESLSGTSAGELVLPASSIRNFRAMTVAFAVRNGADANVPLLAGTYVFKFTATIEAGL